MSEGNARATETGLVPQGERAIAGDWFAGVPRSARNTITGGYMVMLVGVAGFAGWAVTAPIDGAIVAPGVFVATGQNKVIQHLEGGIIRDILVSEGQLVEAGQPLLRLDETAANADLRRLELREFQLLVQDARLRSEERLAERIDLSALASAPTLGPDTEPIISGQQSIFEARRQKLDNEIAIFEQSIRTYRNREAGDTARLEATAEQQRIIEDELRGKAGLFERGLLRLPEYFAVRRAHANAKGQLAHLGAEVHDSRERMATTRHQIERVRSIFVEAAVEERLTTMAELKDIRERLVATRSVIGRLEVRAPVRGIVVKLNYNTPGGVIRPGNDILALLPIGNALLLEARIRPQDIDNLHDDQQAVVRLSALSQRVTPMVRGRVVYVSADAVPNDARGALDNVYVARIRLDADDAARVPGFMPTPGMPAEVYIKTGERTFLEYLLGPLLDTMARAFREA